VTVTSLSQIETLAHTHRIIGRTAELRAILACLATHRNVLLEGPVGVGKTALARAACGGEARGFVRIDGDGRYTEAKLVGHFDPPGVLERGYQPDLFMAGPLVQAMRDGAILFINELNRMPEGVQNVLLPAIDEGQLTVPRLGGIEATPGFAVIATQNPAEFVATGHLSEALRDRFELVRLDYQTELHERTIVAQETTGPASSELIEAAVSLVRATRTDPRVRRGASVRAAIAIADLTPCLDGDLMAAAAIALPTRIEMADPDETSLTAFLAELEKKSPVWAATRN